MKRRGFIKAAIAAGVGLVLPKAAVAAPAKLVRMHGLLDYNPDVEELARITLSYNHVSSATEYWGYSEPAVPRRTSGPGRARVFYVPKSAGMTDDPYFYRSH